MSCEGCEIENFCPSRVENWDGEKIEKEALEDIPKGEMDIRPHGSQYQGESILEELREEKYQKRVVRPDRERA